MRHSFSPLISLYKFSLLARIKIVVILLINLCIQWNIFSQSNNLEATIDSLKTELAVEKLIAESRIKLSLELANEYLNTNKDSAELYATKANELSHQTKNIKGQCQSYNLLGRLAESRSDYKLGLEYHLRSQEIATREKKHRLIGLSHLNIGRVKSILSQYDSAKVVLLEGLEHFKQIDDVLGVAKSYNNLGLVSGNLGELESAIDYFIKASEAFMDPKSGANPEEYSVIFSNMGIAYWNLGEYEKAVTEAKKSINIFRAAANSDALIHDLIFVGRVYTDMKKYDEAKQYFSEAYNLIEHTSNKDLIAALLVTMGNFHNQIGEFQKTQTLLNQSLTYFSPNDRPDIACEAYRMLAEASSELNAPEEAIQYYKEALAYVDKENGNVREKIAILKSSFEFYRKVGRYEEALITYEAYNTLQDSLLNLEKVKNINELQTKYETAEKDKEIAVLNAETQKQELALLKQQQYSQFFIVAIGIILMVGAFFYYRYKNNQKVNKLLTDKNNELSLNKKSLEGALLEKETLLKEIHHRVKNNLQLITSLLNLQADDETPQTIDDFLYKGQNRVKSMALIHEQLYRSERVSSINIKEYTHKLVESIFRAFGIQKGEVDLSTNIEPVQLDIDQAIPLGLIINELVNNSLKHAFDHQTNRAIQIDLKKMDDGLELMIKDNGSGFKNSEAFQNSLGLKLVKLLTRQLKGSIEIKGDKGTEAKLFIHQNISHKKQIAEPLFA